LTSYFQDIGNDVRGPPASHCRMCIFVRRSVSRYSPPRTSAIIGLLYALQLGIHCATK